MLKVFNDFFSSIKTDIKERRKLSAKNLYLLTQYEQIEPDDDKRLQTLLNKQDQFNEAKASHGYTSATFEVPSDLHHRIDEIVKYYQDLGMYVLNIGETNKIAEGHIFLLWNEEAIKQNCIQKKEKNEQCNK